MTMVPERIAPFVQPNNLFTQIAEAIQGKTTELNRAIQVVIGSQAKLKEFREWLSLSARIPQMTGHRGTLLDRHAELTAAIQQIDVALSSTEWTAKRAALLADPLGGRVGLIINEPAKIDPSRTIVSPTRNRTSAQLNGISK